MIIFPTCVVVFAQGSLSSNWISSPGLFVDYTGTTAFLYKIRTTQSTGTGAVNVKITSDFAGAGGPSVLTPPSAGDALTYSCTVAARQVRAAPVE
jgi:hypothetical protein